MKEKMKWTVLLFITILLFLGALMTNSYPLYFLVILLSFFIYKDGNAVLFKEYDDKRKKKYQEYKVVQDAAKEAIQTGKILKK